MYIIKRNEDDRDKIEVKPVSSKIQKMGKSLMIGIAIWRDKGQADEYADSYAKQNGLTFLKN